MNKANKKSRGAALVEFSLTAGVYFTLIFCIYEVGLMLSIRNGLVAGMFYATRAGITGTSGTSTGTIFSSKFNGLSFNTFNTNNLTFTTYTSIANRNSNTGGSTSLTNNGLSTNVVVYNAASTYTFLTQYMNQGATTKNLTFSITVINERY